MLHISNRHVLRSGARDLDMSAGFFMPESMTSAQLARAAAQQREVQRQAREAGCAPVVRRGPGPDRAKLHKQG